MPDIDSRLMQVSKAAKTLDVSTRTIYRMIAAGRLKATKSGDGKTSSWLISKKSIEKELAKVGA